MTLEILTRYYELEKKIREYEETARSLRAAAESTTSRLSDMPKSRYVDERLSRYIALIIECEKKIEMMRPVAESRRKKVTRYVNGIEDMFVKSVISLRFLEIMPWGDVAEAVGGGNTDDTVRMAVQRHMDKGK